eukprot:1725910-Prymnesium_polylepis.1
MIYIAVMPSGTLLLALFWLIFLPIFYYRVFLPCWDCYDFEATMAHEIGHVLGFDHPDTLPAMNLYATAPPGNATCLAPFRHVALSGARGGSVAAGSAAATSIMHSMAKHRDRTCLTADDFEGLNFLYPNCEHLAGSTPQCIKAVRLSGWLRLLITVCVPFATSCLLVVAIQLSVRRHTQRRLASLQEEVSREHKVEARCARAARGPELQRRPQRRHWRM